MNRLMNIIAAVGLTVLVAYALYVAGNLFQKIGVSRGLVEAARPFVMDGNPEGKTLLVLGDSTAVGVGASKPEDSLAGRFAMYKGVSYVENYARSGAKVAELPIQITNAKLSRYTYILIAIGGNDIIAFGNADVAMKKFAAAYERLPEAGQVIVHSAGNVGGASIFPSFIRPLYTSLTLKFHAGFEKLAAEKGFTYVNLYTPTSEDPFVVKPETYLAPDGLHPSSEGYTLWFSKIAPEIRR